VIFVLFPTIKIDYSRAFHQLFFYYSDKPQPICSHHYATAKTKNIKIKFC